MLRVFHHFVPKLSSTILIAEFLILLGSLYLSLAILARANHFPPGAGTPFLLSTVVFAVVMVLSMAALGMYHLGPKAGLKKVVNSLIPAFLVGLLMLALLFHLIPYILIERDVLLLSSLLSAGLVLGSRAAIYNLSKSALARSRIIFLGGGSLAEQCRRLASQSLFSEKFEIVGFIPVPLEPRCVAPAFILPSGERLATTARKYRAREIVVSVQNRRSADFPIEELLECKLQGIKVTAASTFFEREACQIRVDSLQPSWLIFSDGFNQSMSRIFIKRAFDILVSILMLMLTLPVMLLTALYIRAEDGGPVFYRQQRVGHHGKLFWILKFRSMKSNAEADGKARWAAEGDTRITKVGHFIRRVRIDELPQIFNVLKGDMSFVGPRPERPQFVLELNAKVPFYDTRHTIKPGITGFAQVRYPYGASLEDAVEKLHYDLYYVKNNSLFLDVLILIDTVQVVLFGKGGR